MAACVLDMLIGYCELVRFEAPLFYKLQLPHMEGFGTENRILDPSNLSSCSQMCSVHIVTSDFILPCVL